MVLSVEAGIISSPHREAEVPALEADVRAWQAPCKTFYGTRQVEIAMHIPLSDFRVQGY